MIEIGVIIAEFIIAELLHGLGHLGLSQHQYTIDWFLLPFIAIRIQYLSEFYLPEKRTIFPNPPF
jgi:hypothetical protein